MDPAQLWKEIMEIVARISDLESEDDQGSEEVAGILMESIGEEGIKLAHKLDNLQSWIDQLHR